MFHLAQVNVARMRGAIDSPVMHEFAAQLEAVNALAEAAPGFVWRLKTDSGNATSIRAFDDEFIIVNMSVWVDIDSLFQFVYYEEQHSAAFRRRADWFEKMQTPAVALWWIDSAHRPTVEEAKHKLEHLHQHGPTTLAFTFKKRFTPIAMTLAE
jgi:hypothetical protein